MCINIRSNFTTVVLIKSNPFTFLQGALSCNPPNYIPEIGVTCDPESSQPKSVTYADPDHCRDYYECFNGCAAHLQCAQKKLYDEVYGCNTPELVSENEIFQSWYCSSPHSPQY